MTDSKKMLFLLPNIFTALNIACGFGSILFSIEQNFYYAALILILGALFDSVDGKVARLTGTQSQFGEQFDSISDVISFGVAPAVLVFYCFLGNLERVGMVIAFTYLLCGALRLARFNVNIEKVSSNYFQGLPIPVAALSMVGAVLMSNIYPDILKYYHVFGAYIVVYALLMISNITFFSFKSGDWMREHKKSTLLIIIFLFYALFIYQFRALFVIINLYVIISVIFFFVRGGKLKDAFFWHENDFND